MSLVEIDSPEFTEIMLSIRELRRELKIRDIISRFESSSIDVSRPTSLLSPSLRGDESSILLSRFSSLLDRVYGNDGIVNAPGFRIRLPVLPESNELVPPVEEERAVSQANIGSSVAFVNQRLLEFDDERRVWRVNGGTVGTIHGVCECEASFVNEFACAYASGVLVGRSTVLTARHVVREFFGIDDLRVVFGFELTSEGSARREFAEGDVYRIDRILAENLDVGVDWALVVLEREVEGRQPIAIREEGRIEDNAPLYSIGYPLGVAKKATSGAVVRDNAEAGFFLSNLDAFDSNSGSPVFNATNDLLEGIHIAGEQDFVRVVENGRTCNRILRLGDLEGRGETVTRISEIARMVDFSALR